MDTVIKELNANGCNPSQPFAQICASFYHHIIFLGDKLVMYSDIVKIYFLNRAIFLSSSVQFGISLIKWTIQKSYLIWYNADWITLINYIWSIWPYKVQFMPRFIWGIVSNNKSIKVVHSLYAIVWINFVQSQWVKTFFCSMGFPIFFILCIIQSILDIFHVPF